MENFQINPLNPFTLPKNATFFCTYVHARDPAFLHSDSLSQSLTSLHILKIALVGLTTDDRTALN